jgi:hypothetical protein
VPGVFATWALLFKPRRMLWSLSRTVFVEDFEEDCFDLPVG